MRARLRALRREGGYSLVELLVVILILGIILAGITGLFVSATKAQVDMDRRFQAQQIARLALVKVRREAHCASAVSVSSDFTRVPLHEDRLLAGLARIGQPPSAEARRRLHRRHLADGRQGALQAHGRDRAQEQRSVVRSCVRDPSCVTIVGSPSS